MSKITQGLEWLNKEIKKDEIQINEHKQQLINEILSLKKDEMFSEPKIKKISFLDKLKKIFGYG